MLSIFVFAIVKPSHRQCSQSIRPRNAPEFTPATVMTCDLRLANTQFQFSPERWINEKVKGKGAYIVNGFPSPYSYGTSLAIWDHAVLPAARHKWTRPALTPVNKLVLDLPTPEGWKAEWPRLPGNAPDGNRTRDLSITNPTPYQEVRTQ